MPAGWGAQRTGNFWRAGQRRGGKDSFHAPPAPNGGEACSPRRRFCDDRKGRVLVRMSAWPSSTWMTRRSVLRAMLYALVIVALVVFAPADEHRFVHLGF